MQPKKHEFLGNIMSILFSCDIGWFISHSALIEEIYKNVNKTHNFTINSNLFKIISIFKKPNKKHNLENEGEIKEIQEKFIIFRNRIPKKFLSKLFINTCDKINSNEEALNIANTIYNESGKCSIHKAIGLNSNQSIIHKINGAKFLFPENSKFYCHDINELNQHLNNEKFDLILLDPPWWNKFIRRKRKHTEHAYNMMNNSDLKDLPLEELLKPDGMIVVWCTNSNQHLSKLINEIMPKWEVQYSGKWYWVKVTQSGEPICEFSKPPRKQPFEQIIFGTRNGRKLINPPDKKLVVSVPSAIHSHKPPLIKLLKPFLPTNNPKCLEIFARYLLPNWTSYGNEVLRFQHECLYTDLNIKHTV